MRFLKGESLGYIAENNCVDTIAQRERGRKKGHFVPVSSIPQEFLTKTKELTAWIKQKI